MPFTLGWHPYFALPAPDSSSLTINGLNTYKTDYKGIVVGSKDFKNNSAINLKDAELDDAFKVDAKMVQLKTSRYSLHMRSSETENYIQVYLPKNSKHIAIEPMTGVSNSFNNKIGLQFIEPGSNYSLQWDLRIYDVTPESNL